MGLFDLLVPCAFAFSLFKVYGGLACAGYLFSAVQTLTGFAQSIEALALLNSYLKYLSPGEPPVMVDLRCRSPFNLTASVHQAILS